MHTSGVPHWMRHAIDEVSSYVYDAWVGATTSKAMPAHQRRLCEFKLAVGVLATAFCLAVDENMLLTTATSIPAVESMHDFIHAGAEWLKDHHHHTHG